MTASLKGLAFLALALSCTQTSTVFDGGGDDAVSPPGPEDAGSDYDPKCGILWGWCSVVVINTIPCLDLKGEAILLECKRPCVMCEIWESDGISCLPSNVPGYSQQVVCVSKCKFCSGIAP